jgi:hypothetical protein
MQKLRIAVRESARQGTKRIDIPLAEETELERRIHAEFQRKYGQNPHDHDNLVDVPFTRSSVIWTVAGWL